MSSKLRRVFAVRGRRKKLRALRTLVRTRERRERGPIRNENVSICALIGRDSGLTASWLVPCSKPIGLESHVSDILIGRFSHKDYQQP